MSQSKPDIEIEADVYRRFDRAHHDLFVRTWQEHIDAGAGKLVTEEQLRCLYERNPAGDAVVAVAREAGAWVGAVAAIPTNIHLPEGGTTRALQIGDFMVDPRFQGRGLGGRLLASLTRFLKTTEAPVYTFPNHRSIPLFFKQQYSELGYIPARVMPLVPALVVSACAQRGRAVRVLSLKEAARLADELTKASARPAEIVKDSAYLEWRWSLIRHVEDYRFLRIESKDGAAPTLIVWSRLKYRHIPLQLIVDFVSSGSDVIPIGKVAADGLRQGALMSVCNIERRMRASPPLAVRVPIRNDPRQAHLLVPPGDPRSASLFANSRFVMGDWMGV